MQAILREARQRSRLPPQRTGFTTQSKASPRRSHPTSKCLAEFTVITSQCSQQFTGDTISRDEYQKTSNTSARIYLPEHTHTLRVESLDFLIVEDDTATSELLAQAVKKLDVCSAVHQAYSLISAQHLLAEKPSPAMMLCDIGLPDGDGLTLVAEASNKDIPVIVISAMGDEATVVNAIEYGASGYLHKDLEIDDITRAIEQVFKGGSPLSPTIATHLLRRFQHDVKSNHYNRPPTIATGKLLPGKKTPDRQTPDRQTLGKLTNRETQILKLIARGYLLSEVADELSISKHTVSNHNRNIYRKLSARSRTEAVYNALSNGIIASD